MDLTRVAIKGDDPEVMKATIAFIGNAIKKGSRHLPLRNYSAALASQAPPKDYLNQVKRIYDAFTKTWRYVKDPVSRELVSYSPEALYNLVIGADGKGAGLGFGVGDCDCASAALGAQLESIGIPVRLATTASPKAPMGGTFGHVFIQAKIPRLGWVSVDPVLFPTQPFGATAKHSRIAYWDLNGNLLGAFGNYVPPKKKREVSPWHFLQTTVYPIFKAYRLMTDISD